MQRAKEVESKALRGFRNGIEEEKTYLDYKNQLDKFCAHANLSYDEIVKLEIDDLHEDGSYRYNIVFNTHNDIRQEAAKMIITCNNETQTIYVQPPEPLH